MGADFGGGFAAFHPAFIQPVYGRLALFGGDNFHALAVLQRGGERHDLAVHLGAAAAVAQAAVQGVGEVDGGGAHGQGEHFAVRGEHINGVVEELGLECGGEVGFAALGHVFAPIQKLAQPGNFLLVCGIAFAAFFITPVRGHAEFVELVHFFGADLHLDAFVFRADNHGVQAFVAVAFGVGDVVVEFAGDGLPQAVHDAQHGVALGHAVHQHAHGADVVEPFEIKLFLHHLAVDGVDVFGAAGHVVIADAVFGQLGFEDAEEVVDIVLPLGAFFVEQVGDAAVFFGILVAEAEVFELPFELPHAQAVGQRGENIQRFFGNAAFFRAVRAAAEVLHGAGAQGELDQYHADVGHHGQQHFAHGFGLRGTLFRRGQAVHAGKVGELLHLVDTLHQAAYGLAALLGYLKLPIPALLGHARQYGGGHGFGQQIELRHHLRRAHGVRQQRLAGVGLRVGRVVRLGQCGRLLQKCAVGLILLRGIVFQPGQTFLLAGYMRV